MAFETAALAAPEEIKQDGGKEAREKPSCRLVVSSKKCKTSLRFFEFPLLVKKI